MKTNHKASTKSTEKYKKNLRIIKKRDDMVITYVKNEDGVCGYHENYRAIYPYDELLDVKWRYNDLNKNEWYELWQMATDKERQVTYEINLG